MHIYKCHTATVILAFLSEQEQSLGLRLTYVYPHYTLLANRLTLTLMHARHTHKFSHTNTCTHTHTYSFTHSHSVGSSRQEAGAPPLQPGDVVEVCEGDLMHLQVSGPCHIYCKHHNYNTGNMHTVNLGVCIPCTLLVFLSWLGENCVPIV